MRREAVLKILLVLTVAVMLFALPANVFAATTDTGFDDFWDDQGGLTDIQPEPEQQPEPEKQPESQPEKQPEQQKPNTDIPKAGLVEDTMMMVVITVLGLTAVYAYKKVKEYQNI